MLYPKSCYNEPRYIKVVVYSLDFTGYRLSGFLVQSIAHLMRRSRGSKFEFQISHIAFMEIDHEIISKVNLPLPLIQEGQFSVTDKRICTSMG